LGSFYSSPAYYKYDRVKNFLPTYIPSVIAQINTNQIWNTVSPDSLYAIYIVVGIFCVLVFFSSVAIVILRNNLVIKAGSALFLFTANIGILIAASSVFALAYPFSVNPFKIPTFDQLKSASKACQVFPFLLNIGFILCLGSMICKSERVFLIFNSKKLGKARNLTDNKMMIPLLLGTLGMTLFCTLSQVIDPSESEIDSTGDVTHGDTKIYLIKCKTDSSSPSLIFNLVMNGIISFWAVRLARRTENIPSRFNESKTLAASSYNICLLCAFVM